MSDGEINAMSQKAYCPKLFLPPKFLSRESVSVEILPEGVHYLLSKKTPVGLTPASYGFIPLPVGSVSLNKIEKRDLVIKALVDIRKKTGVNFVRFSIPEGSIYFFKAHTPNLKPKEIHDILDFKIEENVPLSAKEAVFDYDIIPNLRNTPGLDLMVFVAPSKVIEEYNTIFELAELMPIFFSPESNNVAKAVVKQSNEQIIVLVNIRGSKVVLSLVIFGIVTQTSSINFGGSTFVDSLVKHYNISFEEAVKMRNEKLYRENPLNEEIFLHLINSISVIKDEIYKFILYCNQRKDIDGQVDKVILCGRDAMIVGFEKYLSSNLNIKVEIANVWVNNFDLNAYVPEINKLDSMDLAVLNGLNLF